MNKSFLILICLFMGVSCFAKQEFHPSRDNVSHRKNLALVHTGIGNANILFGEYNLALEDFKRSESLINHLETRMPEVDFWISFGKAVTYDNLWNRDECERSIGALVLLFSEIGEQNQGEDFFINIVDNQSESECKDMIALLKKVAETAPSTDVRIVLSYFIEGIEEGINEIFYDSDDYDIDQI